MTPTQEGNHGNWEKEHAPHISRKHLAIVVGLYCAWIFFLAVLAGNRWLGSLQ